MDLVATLRERIDSLNDGEYIPGLKAVLLHIETAFRHLSRGRKDGDDTAFTDSIYRTNQAFEGSIKEAYRVLAGKEPDKVTPFEIETYLEKNEVFRSRILKQFTGYRTEWRNPSTHDYKLDFDESEAFLAIVSVTAFACLLVDEIAERISFLKSKADTEAQRATLQDRIISSDIDFVSSLVQSIQEFSLRYQPISDMSRGSEIQIIGALHGFLSSTLPNVSTTTDSKLVVDRPFRADLLVQHENEIVIIDVKRRFFKKHYQSSIAQVEHYLLISNIKTAILLFLPEKGGELMVTKYPVKGIDGTIIILKPADEA